MTTCLEKSCSFGLPRMLFVNFCQLVSSYFPFGFEGMIWDLIVSVPDQFLCFHKVLYNAITQNNCFVKGSHKYNVYLVEENKAHLNWPNKDRITIWVYCNAI